MAAPVDLEKFRPGIGTGSEVSRMSRAGLGVRLNRLISFKRLDFAGRGLCLSVKYGDECLRFREKRVLGVISWLVTWCGPRGELAGVPSFGRAAVILPSMGVFKSH